MRLSAQGKNRIAGQVAQLVRLSAKDESKYNFILWFGTENRYLLRLDINDAQNLVEQCILALIFVFYLKMLQILEP